MLQHKLDWTKTIVLFVVIFLLAEIFLYLATTQLEDCGQNNKNSPYYSYLHGNVGFDINENDRPYKEYFDSLHKDQLPFGVTLWGYAYTLSEMGESTRKYAESIVAAGIPLRIIDYHRQNLIPSSHKQLENISLDAFVTAKNDFDYTPKYYINIFINNPDMTEDLFEHRINPHKFRVLKNCYNIAIWGWELDMVPARWIHDFWYYDEVWTESTFIADTFLKLSPIPVQTVFYGIGNYAEPIKDEEDIGRAYFGIPETSFVVYYSFDYLGNLERENPQAVIEAFKLFYQALQQTETKTPDVYLILETSEGGRSASYVANRVKNVTDMAAGLPIKFIDRYTLSEKQQASLYEQVDVYLALPRSEGFSYTLAHFMQLGKPVISTNYSGFADIINDDVAFMVPYTVVPLEEHEYPYEKGNQWSTPDTLSASEQLEFVYKNPEAAKEKGERAKEFINTKFDEEATGKTIKAKLRKLWDGNAVQYLASKQIHRE